jgi:hypothetical protein
MFYYTSNKPISHISLPFSCLLNSFLLLPVHFPSFVFYVYTFFLDNSVLYKFNLFLQTSNLLIPILNSVYIAHILVPPCGVLYTSKCCSTLESTYLNISSETTLSAVSPYCYFTSCCIWTDGYDKSNRCSSAAVQCRCAKQIMKNIVQLVIKLNWFCGLSYLKSHTKFRLIHVIFKKGEHAAHVTIKLLCCTVHNCVVM